MKQNLFYILFSLASVITYGQVTLSFKPDKPDYNAKDLVNLTVLLELDGNDLDLQSQIRLPDLSKFIMVGSGSYNNAYIDPETNTSVTQSIIRIALEPKQKGKIRIGSVLVTVSNKTYKTEPFDIFIRDVEKKPIASATVPNDVFLNMEIEDREVYQEQPTYAVLKAYSKNMDNLRKVKNIQLPHQDNIYVHLINLDRSEIDPYGIANMPSQILAEFMIFPNEAGWIEIPSVSASLASFAGKNAINSNKVKLNVKKFPEGAPASFKNAVGNFKVEISNTSKEKIEVNKPINIVVKLTGEGNLTNLQLPKLEKSKDYHFYQPNIVSRVVPGKEGLKGEVIAKYIVIPSREGNITVKTEDFSFFNPSHKEYITIGSQELPLMSYSHDQVLEERTTVEKVNDYTNTLLETVDSPVLKTTSLKVKEKKSINWNVVLINGGVFSLFVILGFGFRKWQKKQTLVREKSSIDSGVTIAEMEQEIKNNQKVNTEDYFIYLRKLNHNEEFDEFFKLIKELDDNVRKQLLGSLDEDFYKFLEKEIGVDIAEDYKRVKQKVQVEKYSPLKNINMNEELLQDVIKLYSQIVK